VDAGGLLQVGPQSAGAEPGPACYGRGGEEATVTDAHLVLGRLRSDSFLGGGMRLDEAAARRAVAKVAQALGLSLEAAAAGIIAVANEHMARALRVMSVQRGVDPGVLTLACFGGAGGLHVCALAEALDMRRALVPMHAGVLSALGMLVAPRMRHVSLTVNRLLEEVDEASLAEDFARLVAQGREALQREGVAAADMETVPSVDMRYQGQSYTINLPWQGCHASEAEFHQRHAALYGHRLEQAVELVTLRMKVLRPGRHIEINNATIAQNNKLQPQQQVRLFGIDAMVPVYKRESLSAGTVLTGPALITETISTTYLANGWQATVHETGSLLLTRPGG
jgi:N-methylhydantoinase A